MKRWVFTLVPMVISLGTLQMSSGLGRTSERVAIQLTPERRQLIGLRFASVERREVYQTIDTTGNVEPDEQLETDVQTRFAGWIDRVFVDQTFEYVRRGQPLFTVYSPELASTEQEYVLALHARDRVAGSTIEGVSEGADSLVRAAAERLRLLGISRTELTRLARGGEPRNVLTIHSPASGYVVYRNAFPKMYVQPEMKLYMITDFSTVWSTRRCFRMRSQRSEWGSGLISQSTRIPQRALLVVSITSGRSSTPRRGRPECA